MPEEDLSLVILLLRTGVTDLRDTWFMGCWKWKPRASHMIGANSGEFHPFFSIFTSVLFVSLLVFETRSLFVNLAVLELTMEITLAPNSETCLQSAGITDLCHQAPGAF